MSKNTITAAVVILVIVLAGWYLTRPKQTAAPAVSSTPAPTVEASSGAMMQEKNMVSITSSGFSPKDITVKVGESVTWENTDSADHTVNSDPHPTHTLYPFLNVGLIKPTEKKSVEFTKAGKYTYHDHLNPSLTGSVTVQ